ncbi:MAG: hypothetical protein NT118_00710 [Lentisphaerae bacterium]|nr:hypothetical protein [Lentisphaerota bacterium]
MMKKIIILIAIIAGVGTAIGDGIDPGNLVRSGGKYGVNESLNAEPRPGVDVDEMNLQSIDSTNITSAIANKMNVSGVGTGVYNGNWVSFTNMFTSVGVPAAAQANFQTWFVIDAVKDAEAYWGDDNNNNNIENNEWYHRFNLARTDWDTITMANINTNLFAAPVAYSVGTGSHNGGGLRWLANFGKDASGVDQTALEYTGNFPTVAARRNQIAANLIDYCDTNSIPTTDNVAATTSDPTYTGNEITPYINEIGLKATFTATIVRSGSSGSYRYANNYTFSIIPYVEITNVFRGMATIPNLTAGATTFQILDGTLFYTKQQSNGTQVSGTITLNMAAAATIAAANEVGQNDYRMSALTAISTPAIAAGTVGTTAAHTSPATITNVYVQIRRARLMYNSIFADFVKPDYGSDPSVTDTVDPRYLPRIETLVTRTNTGASSVALTRSCCFSYQANDPRQNLNDGDWPQATALSPGADTTVANTAVYGVAPNPATGNTVGTPATPVGTPVAPNVGANDVVTFTADGDMEPSTLTPTTLSTSYIRNGPMVSPWELGAIHRGAAWETINLKEYNAIAGANPSTGGGLYKESATGSKDGGDANILDQIKMTARVENKQKVNLKLQSDTAGSGVLSALFKKIHVGSAYTDNLRLLSHKDNVGQFPTTGNFTGDRWLVNSGAGTVYAWNGSSWVAATKYLGDGYVWKNTGEIIVWNGTAWSGTWSDPGTEISGTDVNVIVADIKARSLAPSSAFKTRAGVVAQGSTLINRTGQSTDREREEIIGKTINLTTVAPSGYFSIIIIAQSIKDVGGGITVRKDLDMNGAIGTADETSLGADINGDGDATDTSDASGGLSETISNCAFGQYDRNADEIMAEQKIRADVYRDPVTGKYTIIRMKYVEE